MVFVIDIGTSSVRGLLLDHAGVIEKSIQYEYCVQVVDGETALQDPEIILKDVFQILSEVGEWVRETKNKIEVISVTGQRSSVIPVTEDGKALSAAISWQDRRSGVMCDRFRKQWKNIYQITGMKLSPVFSAPKMMYLMQNDKELYEKAYKLIGFQEYILFHLTHEFATDTSIASRTSLFDISRLKWSDELMELFGLSKAKLCQLIDVGGVVGSATREVQRLLGMQGKIPVISAGGDQQCAALGMGCIEQGSIEVNSGTGAYAIGIANRPVFHPDMSLNCNVSAVKGKWIVEGAVLSAGRSVEWFVKELFSQGETRDYETFMKACGEVPPGANGVIVSPSLAGKGTPDWNPQIRGGIFHLSFSNKKEEFARALLEGIAAELWDCIEAIEKLTGTKCLSVKAGGGLLRNQTYCQVLSDMFGKAIEQPEVCEATGIGAWVSAETSLGNYKTQEEAYRAYDRSIHKKIWIPDEKVTKLYRGIDKIRKKYEMIYQD
ncbi:hypothetical protein HGO97_002400 [Faecalicatena sp. AGMB00832]|uniref:Xylulokinase n=1 Tax=Faecalicatena faecalis TaxID=2726362 RepID=A0ABS6CZC8_9FIRM|nr:FGGY-family carbohydrate kinase [Faecalicatena faecalis]MBU3874663.1 hypothetical protein [Faecalicatena faecalis]